MTGRTEKWPFDGRNRGQESDWGAEEWKRWTFVGEGWGDERVWRAG